MFLDNVVRANITCYSDVQRIFSAGSSVRATGATIMNATSSRSHAIFSLIIKQRACDDTEGLSKITSKFHLIDLAGSERANSTGATGNRLKEGAMINQSLSALGKVIHALCAKDSGPQAKATAGTRKGSMGKKAALFVPYRDSKLTRLLQDSLGGNSYTLMICNISPALICENETLGSLRFAARAKQIKNKAQISKLRLLEVVGSSQRQPRILSPCVHSPCHRHKLTMLECLSQQCHIRCLVKTQPLLACMLGPTAVQLYVALSVLYPKRIRLLASPPRPSPTTTDFDPKSQQMARLAHELKLAKEEIVALKACGVGSGSNGGGGSGNAKGGRMGNRRQSAEEMVGLAQLREMTADVRLR